MKSFSALAVAMALAAASGALADTPAGKLILSPMAVVPKGHDLYHVTQSYSIDGAPFVCAAPHAPRRLAETSSTKSSMRRATAARS